MAFTSRICRLNGSLFSTTRNYCFNCYSTLSQKDAKDSAPRTSITHPGQHNENHIGLWYTIEKQKFKSLFGNFDHNCATLNSHPVALPKTYMEFTEAFDEAALMIREPSLSAIKYIKQSDLSMLPNKFLLYGEVGNGKTLSLAHIIHFLSMDGWVIAHLQWPVYYKKIFHKYQSIIEVTPSSTRPGKFDHPVAATAWLRHFQEQNSELLSKMDLKTTELHEWSKRENLPAGSPLSEIIEMGLTRSRASSDCVFALIKELKNLATAKEIKLAFVVDGLNAMFQPDVRDKAKEAGATPENFVIYDAFKQFFQHDWTNGCIVGSVCQLASDKDWAETYFPRYLLGKEGWDAIDPFVPIKVEPFNNSEFHSILDYLVENNWIHHQAINTVRGRKELAAVTGKNGYDLIKFLDHL